MTPPLERDELRAALARFDGRDTAPLERLLDSQAPTPTHLRTLVGWVDADERSVSSGASWLLRKHLEGGARLTPAATTRLAEHLSAISDSWARLHICQSMALLDVPAEVVDAFAEFLRTGTKSQHTFERAWAYDGFARLARRHAHLAAESSVLLQRGAADPAASVRARLRRLASGRDA